MRNATHGPFTINGCGRRGVTLPLHTELDAAARAIDALTATIRQVTARAETCAAVARRDAILLARLDGSDIDVYDLALLEAEELIPHEARTTHVHGARGLRYLHAMRTARRGLATGGTDEDVGTQARIITAARIHASLTELAAYAAPGADMDAVAAGIASAVALRPPNADANDPLI